jgi:hypothetical protein
MAPTQMIAAEERMMPMTMMVLGRVSVVNVAMATAA